MPAKAVLLYRRAFRRFLKEGRVLLMSRGMPRLPVTLLSSALPVAFSPNGRIPALSTLNAAATRSFSAQSRIELFELLQPSRATTLTTNLKETRQCGHLPLVRVLIYVLQLPPRPQIALKRFVAFQHNRL